MTIQENISLLPYNTFGMDVRARWVATYDSIDELRTLLRRYEGQPLLPIGEGSNLLFTKDYPGVVLVSNMRRARALEENSDTVWIEAESGLKLDSLIAQMVDMDLTGMENLSYIPGTVGASVVQNVGAYGVEAKAVIDRVEAVDIASLQVRQFTNEECRLAYRDSLFKEEGKGQFIITKVVYRLHKHGELHTEYGGLKTYLDSQGKTEYSAQDVRDAVIAIRKQKLPEVGVLGSAGSFFKNPIVPKQQCARLVADYPQMPYYEVEGGTKIPAAWLIEQCGYKGKRVGGAQVYEKQPLVIVNAYQATPHDVMQLAQQIVDSVQDKFQIEITPEVNYI